jgi:hypothetical protein
MHAPIGVEPFPIVEARHTEGLADQPDVAWTEVKARVSHEPDVFNAVPDVIVRNFDDDGSRRWGWRYGSNYHRRGSHDFRSADDYSTGFDGASRHQR